MHSFFDEIGEPCSEDFVHIPWGGPAAHHHAQLQMLKVGGMNEEKAADGLGGGLEGMVERGEHDGF